MTNKWRLDRSVLGRVLIVREEDDAPIAEMIFSMEGEAGQLTEEQAVDIAQQIIDDWNFSCDELGEKP